MWILHKLTQSISYVGIHKIHHIFYTTVIAVSAFLSNLHFVNVLYLREYNLTDLLTILYTVIRLECINRLHLLHEFIIANRFYIFVQVDSK